MACNCNKSSNEISATLCFIYSKIKDLAARIHILESGGSTNLPVFELVVVDGATYLKTTFPNGDIFYSAGFTSLP